MNRSCRNIAGITALAMSLLSAGTAQSQDFSRVVTSGSSGNGENVAPGISSPFQATFQTLGTAPLNFGHTPRLNNAGQVTFAAYFGGAGTGVTQLNDSGIWFYDGSLSLIARESAFVSGTTGPKYSDLGSTPASLNDAGHVAFTSGLNDGSVAIISTQDGSPNIVAKTGTLAPGTSGNFSFLSPSINNSSTVLVSGNTTAGTGIWARTQGGSLTKLTAAGDQATGLTGVSFSTTGRNQGIVDGFNNNDTFAFRAGLSGTGVTAGNDSSIWTQQVGANAQLALREGQSLGGGISVNEIGINASIVLNNANQILLAGNVIDNGQSKGALLTNRDGTFVASVKTGDVAPDTTGLTFQSFGSVALNDAGQLQFLGLLQGPGVTNGLNNRAIFTEGGGDGLRMLARSGDIAPGTSGAVFGQNSGTETPFADIRFNNAGQTAFVGTLVTGVGDAVASPHNNQGIWATDPFGTLALVARRQTTVLPFTDTLSNPNNVSGQFHPMRINGFNDQGQLLFTTATPNGTATASFIADLGSALVDHGLQLVLDNGETISVPGKVVVGTSTGSGAGSALTIASNTTVVSSLGIDIFADGSAVFSGEVVAPRVDVLGTLTIDGLMTGDVYLGEGGVLNGSGTVLGTVFAADGSVLSFGNSPGEFSAEDFTFADGIVDYRFEIADAFGGNAAAGVNWDFLNVSDTLTFADNALINISVVSGDYDTPFAVANWDGSQQYQWLFMRANNIVGFDAARFVFSTQALTAFDGLNALGQGEFSVLREGNDIFLRFTPSNQNPVPEPSAVVLFAIGAAGLGGLRRRRSRVDQS